MPASDNAKRESMNESAKPTRKVRLSTMVGALVALGVSVAEYADLTVAAELSSAITVVLMAIAGYMVKDDQA